jgi:hypothetical protein
MTASSALVRIPVGVVVERRKAKSQWIDFVWRPVSVLTGVPDTPVWSILATEGDASTFYAGAAEIELFRTETANYLTNLASGSPLLWVVLRPTGGEPPYNLVTVTADPAEGEAFTEAGNDTVDSVPMPSTIFDIVERFIAAHHVERPFVKRERRPADPNALARRGPRRSELDE